MLCSSIRATPCSWHRLAPMTPSQIMSPTGAGKARSARLCAPTLSLLCLALQANILLLLEGVVTAAWNSGWMELFNSQLVQANSLKISTCVSRNERDFAWPTGNFQSVQ